MKAELSKKEDEYTVNLDKENSLHISLYQTTYITLLNTQHQATQKQIIKTDKNNIKNTKPKSTATYLK